MGGVPLGEFWFFLGVVFRAGSGMGHGMVPVILLLTFLVRAGFGFGTGLGIIRLAIRSEPG
jgi:hypothetical protein